VSGADTEERKMKAFTMMAVLVLLCLSLSAVAENYCELRLLPVPEGTTESEAWGINDAGDVAGYANSRPDPNCFSYALKWQQNSFTILGNGEAYDINNSGVVVGRDRYAVRYEGGQSTVMHGFAGTPEHPEWISSAVSLSNSGYVAGWAEGIDYRERAVGWILPSTLGIGLYETYGVASDVNDSGEFVGRCGGAAYWSNLGEPAVRRVYHGMVGVADGNEAYGINNNGVAVGNCAVEVSAHAVMWASPLADPVDLCGDLRTSTTWARARKINDWGLVVGYTVDQATGCYGGWVWDVSSGMRFLPDLGFGCMAYNLNNLGANSDVVGAVLDAQGRPHAAVWHNVVPEPSSLVVLVCGVSSLGVTLWRRRRD
jgi:uncharacterized membrane protein